jgi:hypothetical protein
MTRIHSGSIPSRAVVARRGVEDSVFITRASSDGSSKGSPETPNLATKMNTHLQRPKAEVLKIDVSLRPLALFPYGVIQVD